MEMWKSCFFIGHREADERLLPRLELEIDRLITEEQVRYFYVGSFRDGKAALDFSGKQRS